LYLTPEKQEMLDAAQPARLMPLAVAEGTFRSDEVLVFDDRLARELLATRPLCRLAGIRFLGAIDLIIHPTGRSPHRRRHNRLEHTIGVAHLANLYAAEAGLSDRRRRLLLASALLHDVGHGPLSHTLDPVFLESFGIDHHHATRKVVRGETTAGRAVYEVLREARLDPDEVIAMIDGSHDGSDAFLLAGPINFDTLDGIARSRAFMGPCAVPVAMSNSVRRWARNQEAPQSDFDAFWRLKHEVYALLIGGSHGRLFDAMVQAYMRANLDEFEVSEFDLTEATFRKRHRLLFEFFRTVPNTSRNLHDHLPRNWLEQEVLVRDRHFTVRAEMPLSDTDSFCRRYVQSKKTRRICLAELVSTLTIRFRNPASCFATAVSSKQFPGSPRVVGAMNSTIT